MNSHNDFANPTSAYAEFGNDKEVEDNLKFYLQSFKLPDVSSSPIIYKKNGEELRVPGSSRVQDEIPLSFILDEELFVYTYLYEKMEKTRKAGISNDTFKLYVLDSMGNPILQFNFFDVFLTNISAPNYDVKTNETEMFIDAMLQFSKFDYTRLKEIKK